MYAILISYIYDYEVGFGANRSTVMAVVGIGDSIREEMDRMLLLSVFPLWVDAEWMIVSSRPHIIRAQELTTVQS